eukprot:jgi/Tetstr1/423400/TSEL_014081.t1
MLFSRVLAHRETIARLTDADRTAFFDYTGRILRVLEDDSAARCMAAQVNGQSPLPTRGNPNRHQMEAYLVNMLTWHWKLLHVVDSPIFDNSQNGKRHVETILGVIGRIRFIHAIRKA